MSVIEDIKQVFGRRDNALHQLIVINVLVFAVIVLLGALAFFAQAQPTLALVMRQLELSANPGVLLRHPWTVLSYAFLHRDFFHILFNMLNLYWFGQLIREYLGDRKLVSLYILGALAGATVFLLCYNLIPVLQPRADAGQSVIGASGAVTAIIVAAATLLPDYTFMLLLLGPVKIKWIAVAVVLISLAGINGGNTGGENVEADEFLHGGWGHLISNMFGLISFGPMLEQRWGAQRFLAFWLICGVGAGVLYEGVRYYEISNIARDRQELVANPTGGDFAEFIRNYASNTYSSADYFQLAAALQRSPENPTLQESVKQEATRIYQASFNSPMLGASGALFGLLFAFAYLFPNTELFLLFIPFPIKAKYFVFFYAMYELYAGVHRTAGDNVAHFAHLGGLLIGFIIVKIWERGRSQFY